MAGSTAEEGFLKMDNSEVLTQDSQEHAVKERVFTQSELNDIVGRAKREAAESVRRQQAQQAPQPAQVNANSDDHIRNLASAEIARQKSAWEREIQEKAEMESARRIVDSYKTKIAAGKGEYEDFDSVVGSLQMAKLPNMVEILAQHSENASGVLYELAKNRTKLYTIENMYNVNPDDAIFEVKRLEKSLKANSESSSYKQAKAPLSQQKPSSTAGMGSSKALEVSDYKKMFRG